MRYWKVFSLPLKEGGLSILLPEDRANEYERSIRICEPLQNHNAIDAEFHQEKILQKIGRKTGTSSSEKFCNQRSY